VIVIGGFFRTVFQVRIFGLVVVVEIFEFTLGIAVINQIAGVGVGLVGGGFVAFVGEGAEDIVLRTGLALLIFKVEVLSFLAGNTFISVPEGSLLRTNVIRILFDSIRVLCFV